MDRDDAIRAIAQSAREHRKKPSRGLWIAAGIVAVIAVIGFVALMLAEPGTPTPRPETADRGGYGFGAGLVVGVTLGIAIGYVLARRSRSPVDKTGDGRR